jgi:capsular exopolysaccharide synthesis family protein
MQDHNPWESGTQHPTGVSSNAANSVVITGSSVKRNAFDIDFRRLFYLWPFVIVSVLIAFGLAKLWLRYTVPLYESKLTVSMKDNDQGINLGPSSIFDTRNPMRDKAELIAAPATVKLVVDSLKLHYTALAKGRLKDMDLYNKVSWRLLTNHHESYEVAIKPKKDGSFVWEREGKTGIGTWGAPFGIGKDTLLVTTVIKLDEDDEIILEKVGVWPMAFKLAAKLKVVIGDQSNSATISIQDRLPARANDILTSLVEAYNYSSIDYKSKSLVQSIRFMNQRIAPLSGELDSIESSLARFKSSRGLIGNSAAGELYLTQTAELDAAVNNINLQREVLRSVEQFVNNPNLKEENLSLIGLSDPTMNAYVQQFQQLRLEREKLSTVVTAENPRMVLLESQLAKTREGINQQLRNYRNNIELQQKSISRQYEASKSLLRNTPIDEKQLLERQRQQEIKQSLFLLLLQRKEEANIALASTTSDVRLLSPARAESPISPKPLLIYGSALLAGLLLPLLFGVARELFNGSITNKEQLDQMLSAPVLGSVDHTENSEEQFAIVAINDRTVAAEQIRALRASLRFYATKGKPLVVLTTSSFSGEGKTFLSGNLARSFALQGLRVALLEFDMRKPKLAKRMGFRTKSGISSVLTGHAKPQDIFVADKETPTLHLYPTGIVPPNPSELITTHEMEVFKTYLLSNYDVVIIDTPPVGLVSDAQLLSEWADVSLVVIRFNVTPRSQVRDIESWHTTNKLGKMAVVLNGVKTTGYYGYNYSPYYYRRKYGGNEYYTESVKKNGQWWRKWFSK